MTSAGKEPINLPVSGRSSPSHSYIISSFSLHPVSQSTLAYCCSFDQSFISTDFATNAFGYLILKKDDDTFVVVLSARRLPWTTALCPRATSFRWLGGSRKWILRNPRTFELRYNRRTILCLLPVEFVLFQSAKFRLLPIR